MRNRDESQNSVGLLRLLIFSPLPHTNRLGARVNSFITYESCLILCNFCRYIIYFGKRETRLKRWNNFTGSQSVYHALVSTTDWFQGSLRISKPKDVKCHCWPFVSLCSTTVRLQRASHNCRAEIWSWSVWLPNLSRMPLNVFCICLSPCFLLSFNFFCLAICFLRNAYFLILHVKCPICSTQPHK